MWNEVIENVTGAKWYIDLLTEANDAETYPIYSIQRKQFTSEEIEKIAAPFIEGATGMRDGRISTIEQLQRNIDGANALKYSDYKEEIKYYEEELKTASHQKYESVKEFPVTENIDRYSYYVYRMPDASNPSIMQSTDTLLIKSDNNRIMQLDEHTLDGTNNVKKSERKKLDGERISEQQAIAKAQEYLRQVGIDGFDVVATEKASQLDGNFMTVESIGWTITFVRTMGAGIPFNPNKRLKDNVFYNAVNPSQKGQRRRIAPEYIQIYSDYSGVQEFEWWNQLKITGVISENAQLLSFKEITGILKREIEKMPDWNKAEFNVNNLFLTYVPIGEESLQLRPIWIVSYELIDGRSGDMSFAVDAVDGMIVDFETGRKVGSCLEWLEQEKKNTTEEFWALVKGVNEDGIMIDKIEEAEVIDIKNDPLYTNAEELTEIMEVPSKLITLIDPHNGYRGTRLTSGFNEYLESVEGGVPFVFCSKAGEISLMYEVMLP